MAAAGTPPPIKRTADIHRSYDPPGSKRRVLTEVFGAVFSRQGVRSSLWLALLALLFTLAGAAIVVPWLLAMGFPVNRIRPLGATNPALAIGSLFAVLVALFFLASYAHTALIDFCRRLRAGEPPRIEEALRGKKQKVISYAGALLLFSLIQGVAVAILVAIVAAFVLGIGIPALGGPGAMGLPPGPAPSRGPVVQAMPFDQSQAVTIPAGLIGSIVLGILLLIVWMAYFTVRFTFFRYAVAVDGERAVASLKTSWRLTKGRWWLLFGTFLLLGLVLGILAMVTAFVVALPAGAFAGGVVGILVFGVAFGIAFQAIWYLFGVPVLFYAGLTAYEELKKRQQPAGITATPAGPPLS